MWSEFNRTERTDRWWGKSDEQTRKLFLRLWLLALTWWSDAFQRYKPKATGTTLRNFEETAVASALCPAGDFHSLFKLTWKWCFHFQIETNSKSRKKTKHYILLLWRRLDVMVMWLIVLPGWLLSATGCHVQQVPKAGSSNGPSGREPKISDNRSASSIVAIVHFLDRHNCRFFHLRFCQKPQQKPSAVESFGGSLLRHVSHSLWPHLCLEFVSAASCSNLIMKKGI